MKGRDTMETIIDALLNNSPAYVILAYLIYKDWKNTETVTKALTRLDTNVNRLITSLQKRGDNI